ncbi:MAG: FG-GAP-like repeat-containing protein [Myxococcota bacterium]
MVSRAAGVHGLLMLLTLSGCALITESREAERLDADADGVEWLEDCDDDDPIIGAPRLWTRDDDGDGFGGGDAITACHAPGAEYHEGSPDCDDTDPGVFPGAVESLDADADTNCDGWISSAYSVDHTLRTGETVAGVGDTNNDGFDDFLIVSSDKAHLILGSQAPMGRPLTNEDITFSGLEGFGLRADAGDINNDGYDDVVIGVLNDMVTDAEFAAGVTYVFLGSEAPVSKTFAEADAIFSGEGEYNHAFHVSIAGDVNDDGYEDILIGAPFERERTLYDGVAYLILGTISPVSKNLSEADAVFLTEASRSGIGSTTSGAGDVNGDGFADFLVGATGLSVKTARLFLGSPSVAANELLEPDASFYTTWLYETLIDEVSDAGDFNNDGYDDIMIGAPDRDDIYEGELFGRVYLVLGGTDLSDRLLTNADTTFYGSHEGDLLGATLSAAGDVDGDGFADLIMSSIDETSTTNSTCVAHLLFGSPMPAMSVSALESGTQYTVDVPPGNNSCVTDGAGDVNNDGYADVIFGTPGKSVDNAEWAGVVHLIFGSEVLSQ